MITVSKISKRSRLNRERYTDGARVFADSNTSKVVNEFFNKNEIFNLAWKCKTWSSLRNKATKLDIAELKTVFGPYAVIRWSRTAGCSCGCSPGFVVSGEIDRKYMNANVYVNIAVQPAAIAKLKTEMPKFQQRLNEEIAANKI
jgi:hypothetical protein